ncbi:tetratricopeptide repeat protein [Acidobacteriota bacterium]
MKKRSIEKVILIIFLGMSLSIVGISQKIEDPGVMLRSAIEKEEVDGDLLGAIELYQQIIEKFDTNQAIAAKAQLRIGLCYEKLGQKNAKQALDAYQKVINNYPLQSEEVKAAKEKLSRLQRAEAIISKENKEGFVIRKVIDGTGTGFEGGKPSPDGNKFVFTDWDSGNLAVYESTTGKKRPLTSQASWEEDHIQYVENSTWSPDGKQIVYDWYNENGVIELRIIGLDGLTPRILYKPNKEVIWVQTFDWSSDGKQILACFQKKDGTRQIGFVNAENGSVRVLKTLVGKSWMDNMCFSPDGRYIVYDFPTAEFTEDHDIYLLSTDGGVEISLINHPAYDYVLGWAPDGKNILFASDRTGTFDAFVIQVANGKPQSVPKVIKSDIGILTPRGFTQKGSFYYSTRKGGNNVYTADLGPEKDHSLSLPKKVIKRFEGSNFFPYYSPDGKYIAYLSIRNRRRIICIHNLETGVDREFSLTPFNIQGGRGFRWFPDGSSILARGIDTKGKHGIFRMNVHTGNITPIIPWENWRSTFIHSVELSRDGKTVFYVDFDTTNDWSYNNLSQIMVRDLDTGTEQELYRVNNYTNISLSPDGKWLASSHPKFLKVMPATGGETKDLYKFKEESNRERPITWSSDGKFILFSMKKSGQDGWELCRISAEGGDPLKLGLEMEDGFMNLSAHPDGRHIVFSTSEQANAEYWVMENFLPKTKDKK